MPCDCPAVKFRILIKFGQRDHMENLRAKGEVFMKSLRDFRELENDVARGDWLEGSHRIVQPKHIGAMTLTDGLGKTISFDPQDMVGPVYLGPADGELPNVFCMYCIARPTDIYPVDRRVQTFGDYFIMVKNTEEFVQRFSAAAKAVGLRGEARLVDYFHSQHYSGDTGVFFKSSDYDWQSEFRFALVPGTASPIKLMLGDLSEIMTEVMPAADVAGLLNFDSAAATEAGLSWSAPILLLSEPGRDK